MKNNLLVALPVALVAIMAVACTSEASDPSAQQPTTGATSDELELELVPCRAEDARVSCFNGYASNGQRCASTRDCGDGLVCRGADPRFGGGHCFFTQRVPSERDPQRPGAERPRCPRGSIEASILCAPGFTNTVVSREPHCEACEADAHTARRCLAAGIEPERCRQILNDHRDDGVTIAERCRNAGLTIAQCRRLVSDDAERPDAPIRGDLNGDRRVDDEDVRALERQYGPVRGVNRADLNGDGVVDGADLGLLLGHWGDYN